MLLIVIKSLENKIINVRDIFIQYNIYSKSFQNTDEH